MACYYSVIQYIPNPIADERVNIGLIAYDESGHWGMEQLGNWQRAEAFTGLPGDNLRLHINEFREFIESAGSAAAAVETAVHSWTHSVQLTPPRASLRSVDELLKTTRDQVLVESY